MNDFWNDFSRTPHDGCFCSMIYIAIDYENEPNMKVAASNVNIKIHQLFSKQRILGACETIAKRKTSGGLDTTWLLNNVQTILVVMIIKLILICRDGSKDFNKWWRSMPTKKILGFRWYKKVKIALETVSFWQNISISIFKFSPFLYIMKACQ